MVTGEAPTFAGVAFVIWARCYLAQYLSVSVALGADLLVRHLTSSAAAPDSASRGSAKPFVSVGSSLQG
jgi:hypothetical protein